MNERELLFNSATWLVWIAPFAGIFAASISKRRNPHVDGDRVLRHDLPARITHWTHGLGTAALLTTGILLGLLFMPALVGSGKPVWAVMNIHFFAAVVFLFGTFYYGANTILAPKRLAEHLPTKNAIEYTKRHYGLLLGFKKFTMPPEAKYFESEKMAYIMAAVATVAIIATGFLKVLAHAVNVPVAVMEIATPVHDIATVVMLAFFLAHVFFAAIAPFSWPVLGSMFTGYVSLEHVKHEHAGWLEEIEAADGSTLEDARPAETSGHADPERV